MMGTFGTAGGIEDGHGAGRRGRLVLRQVAASRRLLPKLDLGETACGAVPAAACRLARARPSSICRSTSPTKDIELAHREGYESVEHLKRYTTLGMGTDQGKTTNINALAIMAALRDATIPEAGTTTFRPPYHAGRHRRACRPHRRPSFPPVPPLADA